MSDDEVEAQRRASNRNVAHGSAFWHDEVARREQRRAMAETDKVTRTSLRWSRLAVWIAVVNTVLVLLTLIATLR